MNFDRLRFVAERAELGEQREALFAGDDPRGTRQLPALLRDRWAPRNVTEFNYRDRATTRRPMCSSACQVAGRGEAAADRAELRARAASRRST
jgi:threonine dehydratase